MAHTVSKIIGDETRNKIITIESGGKPNARCIAITRGIVVEPLARYRLKCRIAAYLVTGQVKSLAFVPQKLIPLGQ